ncbi:hypothetical protein HKD37_01G001368 [Glycine soja]
MGKAEEVQEKVKADMETMKEKMATMMEAMMRVKKIMEANAVAIAATSVVANVNPTSPSGINQMNHPTSDMVGKDLGSTGGPHDVQIQNEHSFPPYGFPLNYTPPNVAYTPNKDVNNSTPIPIESQQPQTDHAHGPQYHPQLHLLHSTTSKIPHAMAEMGKFPTSRVQSCWMTGPLDESISCFLIKVDPWVLVPITFRGLYVLAIRGLHILACRGLHALAFRGLYVLAFRGLYDAILPRKGPITRTMSKRLQEDWARAAEEGPRVLMNLRTHLLLEVASPLSLPSPFRCHLSSKKQRNPLMKKILGLQAPMELASCVASPLSLPSPFRCHLSSKKQRNPLMKKILGLQAPMELASLYVLAIRGLYILACRGLHALAFRGLRVLIFRASSFHLSVPRPPPDIGGRPTVRAHSEREAITHLLCIPGQDFTRAAAKRRVRIMRTNMTTLTWIWMTLLFSNILPSDHNANLPQQMYRDRAHKTPSGPEEVQQGPGVSSSGYGPLSVIQGAHSPCKGSRLQDTQWTRRSPTGSWSCQALITGLCQFYGVPVTSSKGIRPPTNRAFIKKYCVSKQAQGETPQRTAITSRVHLSSSTKRLERCLRPMAEQYATKSRAKGKQSTRSVTDKPSSVQLKTLKKRY